MVESNEAKPEVTGVEVTRDLLRKRAEHNEMMLSTLEEVSLHQ